MLKIFKRFSLTRELKKNGHEVRVELAGGQLRRNYFSLESYKNDKENYEKFLLKRNFSYYIFYKIDDNGKLSSKTIKIGEKK